MSIPRGTTLAINVKRLLLYFHLIDKGILYVKDEGSNLRTLASSLPIVGSCKPLALLQPYPQVCFRHIMLKVCQNSTYDTKLCVGMKKVSIKDTQTNLKKQLHELKSPRKEEQSGIKHEWRRDFSFEI